LEAFSGATLERPKLIELREWIRGKEVDAVIAYALDRLSRDPVDFIILQDEIERAGLKLIFVTEDVDTSDMGKLIGHIRGFAAKLEREKIRERTMRGKKTRVEKLGKLPCGRGVFYGYDYDKETGTNIANANLDIVRLMGQWLIQEHMPLRGICRRLMERNIPAPRGGRVWSRGTIGRLMRNSSYAGKTYANKTKLEGKKRVACDNLIEIPNAVDKVAFTQEEWEKIQYQLDRNREFSIRNAKHSYLLRGIMYCKKCGRKLYGRPSHGQPYYTCCGKIKPFTAANCDSKSINATWLEKVVWETVEKELLNPDFLENFVKGRDKAVKSIENLQGKINLNKSRLATLEEGETRFLRLYGAGLWTVEKLEPETKRLRVEVAHINKENREIDEAIKRIGGDTLTTEEIKARCQYWVDSFRNLDLTNRRVILETLGWKIGVDNDMITVECNLNPDTVTYLPMKSGNAVSQHPQ
jgi:site-specific DNA recombinase